MKKPAWKSANAEIAKKRKEEKANKEKIEQKLEEQRRALFIGLEPHITHHNCDIVTLRVSCKVDDRSIYDLAFKQRYQLIREKMMENLTPILMDYIDIDRHSHYGLFDETWEGTIRVVKNENW